MMVGETNDRTVEKKERMGRERGWSKGAEGKPGVLYWIGIGHRGSLSSQS